MTKLELKEMVLSQLKMRGICDKVCDAFLEVDRKNFVREDDIPYAYDDMPLPIGYGQTISQPYMVAIMLEKLVVKENDTVLEIGSGSGYVCALLSKFTRSVYGVERIKELALFSKNNLKKAKIKDVRLIVADGTDLSFLKVKFDRIIVSAGAPRVPSNYFKKLKEGGRLVIPVSSFLGQTLMVYEKKGGKIIEHNYGGCRFVPLIGKFGYKE